MTAPRRMRRSEQRSLLLMAAALVTFLAGCGEPHERIGATPSTPDATAAYRAHSSVDPARVEAAASANTGTGHMPPPSQPIAAIVKHDSTRHDAVTSFELVGTGIDGANAFAVVRMPDRGLVTVREGSLIGGYTVRGIRPDRIRLKAQDDKEAMLVIGASGGDAQPSTSSPATTPSEASAESEFMAAGINTDQSIPEHVMYGPTARWSDGAKHIH